jgi:hypothetical protein
MGVVTIALACAALSGCSLFVMGQRMIMGDPLQKSEFRTFTHVDLTKGKHKLLIICSTREAIDADLSTLKIDLIDGITRQLKREGVNVVDPDLVATWLDDHGGLPSDAGEIARDFPDVDYIAWIDVDRFTYREDNSEALLRGRSQGYVKVFRADDAGDARITNTVFTKEFNSVYPSHQPISEVNRSAEIFRRDFTRRVSDELAHKFYDHRPGWDI